MIKAAIEKILSLAPPTLQVINNSHYSDKELTRINAEERAKAITMNSLSSLVDFIKNTADMKPDLEYIVQVVSPTEVRLISGLDGDRCREVLVDVTAEVPSFSFDRYIQNEEFIIGVQSKFMDGDAENNDKPIVLKFAGNVKSGTVAEYGDSGVGQKATVKMGAASLSEVEVPSPCYLKPYRTFTEVDQPMSSFIFRIKDDKNYGVEFALFEADGGAWKNEAKANIKAYLEKKLGLLNAKKIYVIS